MSRASPPVVQWRVRTEHRTWIVLAPTKRLAILNFRNYVGFDPILSIGRVRRERRMPAGLVVAFPDPRGDRGATR